ncbi:hypothetical protein PENTCL1PPCAC_2446 [Pristionchus entomophagus]|uniref:RecQ-mediated genome instability protein 1 n=1 Tax=Pristionchus entomophagus TaxID=358040 RepID=A0AAV5SKU4_9BILA|nr:hypothetical protein PENTCL1PPCAC_2446 [Pristionchus entomophagus]
MLTLSDGERELKGMERRSIPSLSLLTSPGCKVVLHPPLICRKGVFLLNSLNIQVLGGDDPDLMETGRPLTVMARLLKREIPKKRYFSHLNSCLDEMMDEDQMVREFEEMDEQFDPADFEPLPSTTVSPMISPTVPTPTPRPPPRSIHSSSTPVTPIQTSSPLINTQSTSSTMRSLHISTPPSMDREVKREIKVEEVIDIDDDSIPSTSTGITKEEGKSGEDEVDESDPFVIAYRSLRLVTLAEAATHSKFQTGGTKRKIEAFVDEFEEALRIVDNLWTMKVQLKDESSDGVECIVHSSVLEKLIGLTVEEANAIKSSTDIERKQEGARRLASTEEILNRLDLIWTIEFFPAKSKVTPIVRDVQTLAEILNAFD